jgi:hypothetical protein
MSQLPNQEYAHVPPEKLTNYLLDLTHKHGKSKAQFFLAFGFTIDAWEQFAEALIQLAQSNPVTTITQTPHGMHYVVDGILKTPDERNPKIRTIWKILSGQANPSLVTAYPLHKE